MPVVKTPPRRSTLFRLFQYAEEIKLSASRFVISRLREHFPRSANQDVHLDKATIRSRVQFRFAVRYRHMCRCVGIVQVPQLLITWCVDRDNIINLLVKDYL